MTEKTIRDPDFGPIRVPQHGISKKEWDASQKKLVEAVRSRRHWKRGRIYTCPSCGKKAFEGRDDITYEAPYEGRIIVFGHLHGGRCKACNAQTLETYELIDIEDRVGVGMRADYEAKVSRIGTGTLGTYWPKDVERVLGLRPNKRAFIEVIGPDTVLVRFRDPA